MEERAQTVRHKELGKASDALATADRLEAIAHEAKGRVKVLKAENAPKAQITAAKAAAEAAEAAAVEAREVSCNGYASQ